MVVNNADRKERNLGENEGRERTEEASDSDRLLGAYQPQGYVEGGEFPETRCWGIINEGVVRGVPNVWTLGLSVSTQVPLVFAYNIGVSSAQCKIE